MTPKISKIISKVSALVAAQKRVEAFELIGKALGRFPKSWELHNELGRMLLDLGKFSEALDVFEVVCGLAPDNTAGLLNKAVCFEGLGRSFEAVEVLQSVLVRHPTLVRAYVNLSASFYSLGMMKEALFCCDTALSLDPCDQNALCNKAAALVQLREFDSALFFYGRAIEVKHDYFDAIFNRALCHFHVGNFGSAWDDYEARKKKTIPFAARSFSFPEWDGSSSKEQCLFVWSEQGIGDEIMFCSMLRGLEGGVKRLVVELDSRLIPLFSRSFPQLAFLPKTSAFPGECDCHVAMGSLGRFRRRSFVDFGSGQGFLSADPLLAANFKKRLSPDGKLLVGVSWISKNEKVGLFKSISLERFLSIFVGMPVRVVSLQYSDDLTSFNDLASALKLDVADGSFVDKFNDLDALSALIEACDLVISISNVTVHLAGSLGKACWVLLPFVPDWRWGASGDSSPWYSSLTLFRQSIRNDWTFVLDNVRGRLINWTASR